MLPLAPRKKIQYAGQVCTLKEHGPSVRYMRLPIPFPRGASGREPGHFTLIARARQNEEMLSDLPAESGPSSPIGYDHGSAFAPRSASPSKARRFVLRRASGRDSRSRRLILGVAHALGRRTAIVIDLTDDSLSGNPTSPAPGHSAHPRGSAPAARATR